MTKWQPIETAPKDGTEIIAYRKVQPPHIEAMSWADYGDTGRWYWTYDGDSPDVQPTHWIPIPPPPEEP
jgi:hypothetical protein